MKRSLASAAAVCGLAAGSLLIGTPAQAASATCDTFYNNTAKSGYMYAFNLRDCKDVLGADAGDEYDWGDSTGELKGRATNNAESVMNKGTGSTYHIVRFSDYTAYNTREGYGCLSPNETHQGKYAADLWDNKLSDGGPAANSFSSHTWVSSCSWWVD
ncbi:hypothetical protein [Streptomyces sp. NPDC001930]|uniref:hypothetical protein n=1 Tax=Streptomyces sp. NPDC001930 TaxID=3364625 RepID=UPI0036C3F848